jgi:PAS domain S-box-containing protein
MSRSNSLLWLKPPGMWSHGIAVLSVAAALMISRWPPLHLQNSPVSLFLCAVILSAWLGGAGPGLLATTLSGLAFYYYFLPPTYSLQAKPEDIPRILIFMLSALFVGSLSLAQRRSTESLRSARDDLKVRVQEIQKTNEALQAESRERIQIDNRLRRSEAYLAEAQRLTHTGSFGWSVHSGEIRWSDETFRIFGCDPKTKLTLELIWQRTHPDDVAFVKRSIERASQKQQDFNIEHRLLMQDGSVKHVHVVAHAETDESGELEFVGAGRDTTESKRVEKELRRSEEFLLEAQKLSHTGSWRHDIASGAITVSPEIYRIHDIERDDDPSKTEFFFSRFHPEDRKRIEDLFERAEIEKTEFRVDYRIVLPDGTIKHLHTTGRPILNESGELVEFVGTAMDVTAAKQAEETLRRSEGYLAEAQRLGHTGSWASLPATGEIKYLSEECYRVMGFDPHRGQPRYKEFFERIHPDDQAKVSEAVETAGCENTEFELDYRIVHPGGEIRDIHVVGHPAFSSSGDLVEYVGTVMDITDRKRAEDRTRLIIDTVPAQLWTESPDGVVDFVNRRWVDYTGMTLEQAVGSGWNRMVHPDDIERVLSKWRTLIAEGKPREIESRLRRSDGTYRWFLSRCYPLIDRSGQILGWYGCDTDIHDRKQAEETLRRSEGYLAEAQRLTRTGSWARDAATDEMRYSSEEFYRVLGFDPHDGPPRFDTFLQRIHPDDQAKVREIAEKARREKEEYELDYRIIHPGGDIRDIHVIGHPVLSTSGDLVEFVGTVMDVTERKRAEGALRRSEAYLAEAQRLTHTGSWAYNIDTKELIHSSEEHSRLFGFDPERGVPSFEELVQRIHPEDRAPAMQEFESPSRAGTDFDAHFRIVDPDGTTKYVYGTGHPVFNASGDLVEFFGTVVNITDRKRAEEERERLRQAQADLAHVNRVTTMGELTASVAHEVNQPIAAAVTNAKTCLRWLTRDEPDVEEARAAALRIVNDGTRAAEIIKRIRLLFKKGTSERELVDVTEVIREMIALLHGEAMRYFIVVRTELEADTPPVMADPVQLQQVLMNLMVNSIDAMRDVVGTRELDIKSQRAENDHVLVRVSDTGLGLPLQQADQLFNAFFTTKPHGTGMGLSISRTIVESHGGRLWAANNSPRGAIFSFTLPTRAEAKE